MKNVFVMISTMKHSTDHRFNYKTNYKSLSQTSLISLWVVTHVFVPLLWPPVRGHPHSASPPSHDTASLRSDPPAARFDSPQRPTGWSRGRLLHPIAADCIRRKRPPASPSSRWGCGWCGRCLPAGPWLWPVLVIISIISNQSWSTLRVLSKFQLINESKSFSPSPVRPVAVLVLISFPLNDWTVMT